jgi:hypothetical protein
MIAEVYDALRNAGADEEKARAAATAVAEADRDIADLKMEIADVRSDIRLLKWMVGAVIALVLGIFAMQWQITLRLP